MAWSSSWRRARRDQPQGGDWRSPTTLRPTLAASIQSLSGWPRSPRAATSSGSRASRRRGRARLDLGDRPAPHRPAQRCRLDDPPRTGAAYFSAAPEPSRHRGRGVEAAVAVDAARGAFRDHGALAARGRRAARHSSLRIPDSIEESGRRSDAAASRWRRTSAASAEAGCSISERPASRRSIC